MLNRKELKITLEMLKKEYIKALQRNDKRAQQNIINHLQLQQMNVILECVLVHKELE